MKLEHIKVKDHRGRLRPATKVTGKKTCLIAYGKLTQDQARKLLAKYEPNPQPARVKGLKKSLTRFRQFNGRPARTLKTLLVPDDAPLVRVGQVPVVTYISKKTGRTEAYKHETNPAAMPTAYIHPTRPFMVLVGGTLKARRWLED